MKILHCINSLSPGGAEKILSDSIAGFKKYWPESKHWIVVLYGDNTHFNELDSLCEEVLLLKGTPFKLISRIHLIRKLIKKNHIEIIHSHLYDSLIFARTVRNARLIHTYHSIDYLKGATYHSPWRIFLDRLSYTTQSIPIYVSNQVKEAVQAQVKKQIGKGVVIPNFYEEKFHKSWEFKERSILKIVAVGNLRQAKNYEQMLDAVSRIDQKKIQLDIYGEGNLKLKIHHIIESKNLNVNLKGNYSISSALLANYDALINTSHIEGMPVSVLEAIASGLPCILPKHLQVMKEIAGEGALYFNNTVDLIEKLNMLIDDRTVLGSLSIEALKKSENYTLEKYIDRIKGVYLTKK